jgi:hypothetical protein
MQLFKFEVEPVQVRVIQGVGLVISGRLEFGLG